MRLRVPVLLAALVLACSLAVHSQTAPKGQISSNDRARARVMLSTIYDALQHNYYDPSFRTLREAQPQLGAAGPQAAASISGTRGSAAQGPAPIDALKARFQKYDEELNTTPTLGAAYRTIAAFMSGLHDSHTFFLPPPVSNDFFYGFRMQMVGDLAFVTQVRPGTDAVGKLHAGDQIISLDGYTVNHEDFEPLSYDLYTLEPRGGLRLQVCAPDGSLRTVEVATKIVRKSSVVDVSDPYFGELDAEREAKAERPRYAEAGSVLIWKQPAFLSSEGDIDHMLGTARKYSGVVLDLRGNPGGELELLDYMLGYFLPAKTTVATFVGRHHQDPLVAKPHDVYNGKLVVLVDSNSASAAEMFARAIQLARRGIVIGDRSAGAVMESKIYPFAAGADDIMVYGASITAEDVLMSDGKSLEHVGVTPDLVLLPSASDLAAGRDPVLAKGVALAGSAISAEAAGKLFPYQWPPFVTTSE